MLFLRSSLHYLLYLRVDINKSLLYNGFQKEVKDCVVVPVGSDSLEDIASKIAKTLKEMEADIEQAPAEL